MSVVKVSSKCGVSGPSRTTQLQPVLAGVSVAFRFKSSLVNIPLVHCSTPKSSVEYPPIN